MALRLFQRERRSLFGEILDWMLTPLLLLWPISLALTWLVAQNIAGKPFDRALEYNVQALSKLVAIKGNQVQFNRKDGGGYEFAAEQVLALDRFNPQIAARLLGAFRSWRSLEPVRRKHAQRVLKRVAGKKGLSRDVYEIVTKILRAQP